MTNAEKAAEKIRKSREKYKWWCIKDTAAVIQDAIKADGAKIHLDYSERMDAVAIDFENMIKERDARIAELLEAVNAILAEKGNLSVTCSDPKEIKGNIKRFHDAIELLESTRRAAEVRGKP